jgi:hypothetical protein
MGCARRFLKFQFADMPFLFPAMAGNPESFHMKDAFRVVEVVAEEYFSFGRPYQQIVGARREKGHRNPIQSPKDRVKNGSNKS